MFARVLSALFSLAAWAFKSSIVKFATFFAFFFITTEFVQLLVPLLPTGDLLSSLLSSLDPGVWWFLDLLKIDYGISAMLSSFVVRFIIRRIPVIG